MFVLLLGRYCVNYRGLPLEGVAKRPKLQRSNRVRKALGYVRCNCSEILPSRCIKYQKRSYHVDTGSYNMYITGVTDQEPPFKSRRSTGSDDDDDNEKDDDDDDNDNENDNSD
jgi:hypothetical protein